MPPDWIDEDNLHVWLALVAGFVGATFDDDDRRAIDAGIRDTDVEEDRRFEYAFGLSPELDVRVARDPGSSIVFVHAAVRPKTTISLSAWRLPRRS